MKTLNSLFRKRLGLDVGGEININNLGDVLEKMALCLPFENLRVINNRAEKITKKNLVEKILFQEEGGLCYELNPILYFFLQENAFQVSLVRGVVYSERNKDWSATGKTHVAILLNHEGKVYLVDGGFGGAVPLKPIPLNGKSILSSNGEFKVEKVDHKYGDHMLLFKQEHKDINWKKGYVFNTKERLKNVEALNDMQKVIHEHPQSSFNKEPLLSKLTKEGSITLTKSTWTKWIKGKLEKSKISEEEFEELKKTYFNL